MFHLNLRSANKNLDELVLYLHSLNVEFHVLVLTETWFRGPGDWLDIPGYTAYHAMRADRRGGGVSILVKSLLISLLLPEFSLTTNKFVLCSVCVTVNSVEYNIVCVCRPPDSSISHFNNTF